MWRSKISPEEWERRKNYLIRSLFEDMPVPLSPIYEKESISPSNVRPESPLPPLIIEVEPRKPNPHDDPDEVYEELEKEIRRMYKKDFLGISTSSSEADTENDSFYKKYDISCGDNQNKLCEENSEYEISQNYETDHIDTSKIGSENKSQRSSGSEITTESILVEVDIHAQEEVQEEKYASLHGMLEPSCEADEEALKESRIGQEDNQVPISQSYQTGNGAISKTQTEHSSQDSPETEEDENSLHESTVTRLIEPIDRQDKDTSFEKVSVFKRFANNSDANTRESSSRSSLDRSHSEHEVMRHRAPFTSIGTPPPPKHSEYIPTSTKIVDLDMEALSEEQSGRVSTPDVQSEIADSTASNLMSPNVTSTPIRKRKSKQSFEETKKRVRRNRRQHSHSSSSEVSSENTSQTSFSDSETAWRSLWKTFFVGEPTFYNLCRCKNHVCS